MARALFLTAEERSQVQRMYQDWLNYLNPDAIVGDLFVQRLLSDREREEYNVKETTYDKAEFLYTHCMMKATYSDLQKVRDILLQNDHRELGSKLPTRAARPAPPQRYLYMRKSTALIFES